MTSSHHSWIWFLAAALLALASTPGEAAERKLFRFGADKLTPSWDAIAEEHSLEVDFGLLSAKSERLELELPGGDTYVVTATDFEYRAPGRYVWRGEILETPDSAPVDVGEVTLTVHDGFLVGRLVTPSGTYTVQPRAAGGHSIARVDPDRLPGCGGGEAPDELLGVPADEVLHDPVFDKARKVITVLGVYTGAARNGAGGRAQMEALINGSVDLLNTAFQRSRVDARARLVHTALIALPDRPSMFDALPELRRDPQVAALRNRWRADVVSGYYENDQRLCGIGYVMHSPGQSFAPFAYSITLRLCAPGITTAHEIGHNLGLEHNPENSSATPAAASFPWSFGHYHSVKVLDGCGFNDRFWVFAAATTNVEFTLRVVDTLTGYVSEYVNPLGIAAGAITDSSAFATCSASAGAAADDLEALAAPAQRASVRSRHGIRGDTGACSGDSESLCLNRERFRVEVEWSDFEGNQGAGSAVASRTDDSGLFWFFDEANWEMLVKVLDGCGVNGHFWVFSAATTNVAYTLRVIDTETGEAREYTNALGNRAPATADTEAFTTCS